MQGSNRPCLMIFIRTAKALNSSHFLVLYPITPNQTGWSTLPEVCWGETLPQGCQLTSMHTLSSLQAAPLESGNVPLPSIIAGLQGPVPFLQQTTHSSGEPHLQGVSPEAAQSDTHSDRPTLTLRRHTPPPFGLEGREGLEFLLQNQTLS